MIHARILVVEDEQITAEDIATSLQNFGHEVVGIAGRGQEAIRLAAQTKPDLVLMDIRLKGEPDGTAAALEIRERFSTPCVYLTAHADDATLDRARKADPLGYIVKPFDRNELHAAIQMALHKSGTDKAAALRERDLASTLETVAGAVIRVDSLGLIVYQNPAAEKWTGWATDEAAGSHFSQVLQFVDSASGKSLESFLQSALRAESVVEMPENVVVRSRDGVQRSACGSVAPVRDPLDHHCGAVIAFCKPHTFKQERQKSPAGRPASPSDEHVIAVSPTMRYLLEYTKRIADSGVTTILLQGESGVGKDVLAKFLHRRSGRRDKPFVAVNCAAIPDTLLESELFGYEKGAFTDARSQKKGVLELADAGTVFLDEVGDMQLHVQAKLLRVLEEQSFRRLGGLQEVSVNVRIIAASNQNLAAAVQDRSFREDLYYRLNVIQIAIPPLRERRADIIPLADHFVAQYNARFKREIKGLSPEAQATIKSHDWPGNIRQLRNTIERAMVLEDSSFIQATSLDFGAELLTHERAAPPVAAPEGTSLREMERTMVVQALQRCGGNQTRAARMLQISRDVLRYRMKKYKLK